MSEDMPVFQPREISVKDMKERLDKFVELKTVILKGHIETIGKNQYIKKSGWRVAATVFGLSDEIISHQRQDRDDGTFVITYHVKCTDPQGRTSIGVASCDSREREYAGMRIEHDTATMAHTRAKNRAISDIIGTGEVSAEEMAGSNNQQTKQGRSMASRYDGKCKTCGAEWKQGAQISKIDDHWCVNPECKKPDLEKASDIKTESKETKQAALNENGTAKPNSPTPEQLKTLDGLEYKGPPPRTSYEAALAIKDIMQTRKVKK